RRAEIGAPRATRPAVGMGARAAHQDDDEVAGTHVADGGSDFDHFAERFMPDDQIVGPRRRGAVGEGADLFVRAADAHFEYAPFDMRRLGPPRLLMLDDLELLGPREHRHGFHRMLASFAPSMGGNGGACWAICPSMEGV